MGIRKSISQWTNIARRCVRCIALSSHSSDAIRAAEIEKERKRESALPLITHARVAALESPGAFTGNATMKEKKIHSKWWGTGYLQCTDCCYSLQRVRNVRR